MPESSPESHVIDFRAAEQLLAARDPRGAVKLLDSVIAAHPENTAARLLRARAFFASAQLRAAELERRLAEHAAGKGANYTRGRGPFRLVYSETCAGRAEATRREAAIKLMDKAKKRLLFS